MSSSSDQPVDLDENERRFLRAGLLDWSGPAQPTDALAVALGFSTAERMSDEAWALWGQIEAGDPLTQEDWRRVLLAVEVVFVSDVVGSGLDWSITAGIPDSESIEILRSFQRKLPHRRGSVQFTVSDQGNAEIIGPDRPTS